MKKTYLITFTALTGLSLLLAGCKKTIIDRTPVVPLDNKSVAQVYVATVNASTNFVTVDGNALNGTALATGGIFPAAGDYAFAVNPGLRTFGVTGTSQPVLTFAENFQVGNNYTIFLYDTTTTVKQKTVITPIIRPTDGTARLRFANFPYSPNAIPNVDIFSKRTGQNVFTNVATTEVTPFISVPGGVSDTFVVRHTGIPTNLQNYTTNTAPNPPTFQDVQLILTPTAGRSYTLVFRGSYRTFTPITATQARTLVSFINY